MDRTDRFPELDDVLQDLSEELGRRLVVVDQNMKVIAYSIHESPTDRHRLFHLLAHSDAWNPPHAHTRTILDGPDVKEVGPLEVLRLLDSTRHVVGFLLAAAVETGEVQLPDTAASRLSALLEARAAGAAMRQALARRLTADLVGGDTARREAAADELVREGLLSDAESYCAVALGVGPQPTEASKAQVAVANTLRFVRDTSTATVTGTVLDPGLGVLVFPRAVVVQRLTRILDRPQTRPVRAGIGPLTPLKEVHRSLELARLAWRASWLAPGEHGVVETWENAGLDGTLARLPVEDFSVFDLPPLVRDLLATAPSATLLETLEAYLDAGGDAKQTAQILNVHRSTLYYRLDQLRPSIRGDLGSGTVRRDLQVGLRMARLARLL